MILSLDESIQKLKTEIISQDWSLSRKKIEPLQAAFSCLKNRFSTRKNALAILTMADSILLYAQKRKDPVPPEFIDFLKEAMAHVVNIYEDGKFDPDRDAELCKRVYGKFAVLKEKVAAEKGGSPRTVGQGAGSAAGKSKPSAEPVSPGGAAAGPAPAKAVRNPSAGVAGQAAPKARAATPLPIQPGAMIRPLTIGKLSLAIAEEYIALVKPLSPKKRKKYIKSSQIPMKDLGGWFCRLSARLKGPLALLKNRKLKKMILPLLVPRGMGLADIPDEEATMLVVVSSGHWHGVILCRLAQEAAPLLSLAWAKNGDIVGPARLGEDQELQLLHISQLLEREGFSSCPGKGALHRADNQTTAQAKGGQP